MSPEPEIVNVPSAVSTQFTVFASPVVPEAAMSVTVIRQDAAARPSAETAVITAVPALYAVTTPVLVTDATMGLSECHSIPVFVALAGRTYAVSWHVSPRNRVSDVELIETLLTGMIICVQYAYRV